MVRLAYLGKECNTKRISQRKLVVAIILMTSNCFAAHLFLQSIASDGVTGNVFCVPSIDLLQCDLVWVFFPLYLLSALFSFFMWLINCPMIEIYYFQRIYFLGVILAFFALFVVRSGYFVAFFSSADGMEINGEMT